jgi:hypothetical protein
MTEQSPKRGSVNTQPARMEMLRLPTSEVFASITGGGTAGRLRESGRAGSNGLPARDQAKTDFDDPDQEYQHD